LSLNGISQNKIFVKWNNTEFTNVSTFTSLLMCSNLPTVLQDTSFFLPTTKYFFKFLYSKITGESAWWSCLGPLGVFPSVAIEGHQNWTHFDSGILKSRTFLLHAGSSCTLRFCLYLLSCTQKMYWREHSLADTVPLFLVILRFSSEVSKNWGTGLPSYIQLQVYLTLYVQLCALDDGWRKRLNHVEYI